MDIRSQYMVVGCAVCVVGVVLGVTLNSIVHIGVNWSLTSVLNVLVAMGLLVVTFRAYKFTTELRNKPVEVALRCTQMEAAIDAYSKANSYWLAMREFSVFLLVNSGGKPREGLTCQFELARREFQIAYRKAEAVLPRDLVDAANRVFEGFRRFMPSWRRGPSDGYRAKWLAASESMRRVIGQFRGDLRKEYAVEELSKTLRGDLSKELPPPG